MKTFKPIKPIKTEKEYDQALQEIDRLIDAKAGSPEHDRLEVLSILVQAYEENHHPIFTGDIEPADILRFWLDQNNLSPGDLEPYIGNRAKVAEIMSGKRSLTLTMIRKLVGAGIPAELLIKPLFLEQAA